MPLPSCFDCSNGQPLFREVQYEAIAGEQLAVDVAALSGLSVEKIRSDGVQASLVALYLTESIPENRQDLIRLATGESFVRPTAFHRVTATPGANVLTVDVEIDNRVSNDPPLAGNQLIDATRGILPAPVHGRQNAGTDDEQNAAPNAEQTASAGIPPTVPTTGTMDPESGRNEFPVESLRLMNETLHTHRLSRSGPVNREVADALSRMDVGKELTKIWNLLDEYVTTDSEEQCRKVRLDANELADRMYVAQVGLAEAVYRREWSDGYSPLLSLLLPGTRSGGLSGLVAGSSTQMSTRMAQCPA